jgi:cell division transport system ATP-binding protein
MSQAIPFFKNVTIHQEDKVILSNINLDVNRGEFYTSLKQDQERVV